MTGKYKISSVQLLVIMFISNIFFTMMYSPKGQTGIDSLSFMISELISVPLVFLTLFPFYYITNKQNNSNIITCSFKLNKAWGKITSILYWLYMMFVAVNTIANFEFFLSTAIYPQSNSTSFILIMMAVILYACLLGIEPIARLAGFVIIIVVISLLFILIPLFGEAKLYHLHFSSPVNIKIIASTIYMTTISNNDFVLLLLLNDITDNKLKKPLKKYIGLIVIFYELIAFVTAVTFGSYGKTILFPLYSLSAISEISILERMDSIHMMIWVFVAFLKACVFLFVSAQILSTFTKLKLKKSIFINTALVTIMSLIISKSFPILHNIDVFSKTGTLFLTFVLILPLITIIGLKFSERKKEKIEESN